MKYAIAFLLLSVPAQAADKALILSDQEQAAYRAILDSAVKANGLNTISRNAFILSDKLDASGIVTERKADPAPAKPDESKD